jgi:hypothetical protein
VALLPLVAVSGLLPEEAFTDADLRGVKTAVARLGLTGYGLGIFADLVGRNAGDTWRCDVG